MASILTPIAVHVPDYDCFWHLKTGELILRTGQVPRVDPFSFTVLGRPWIAHEWIPEVVFAWIAARAGLDALVFLKSILLTATMAVLWGLLGAALGRFPLARLVVCLAVFASLIPTMTVRPWMVSFLMLTVMMATFLSRRLTWKASAAVLGILIAAWINLHGMWVVGCLWLTLQALGALSDRACGVPIDRGRDLFRPILAMAMGALGSLAHPARLAVLTYPLEYQFTKTHDTILEWQPVDLRGAYGRFLVVAFALGLFILARAGSSGAGWWTFSVFSYLAFTSRRNIALMCLAAAPFVALSLAKILVCPRSGRPISSFLWRRFDNFNDVALSLARSRYAAILLVLLALFFFGLNPRAGSADSLFKTPSYESMFPVEATLWLHAQPRISERRIFNFYGWGGYLIGEGFRTFIDGRADLFGLAMIEDYQAVMGVTPRWREVLARHQVDMVLVPSGCAISQVLAGSPEWALVHADATAMVFRRVAS